jgi:hypothetical protein
MLTMKNKYILIRFLSFYDIEKFRIKSCLLIFFKKKSFQK